MRLPSPSKALVGLALFALAATSCDDCRQQGPASPLLARMPPWPACPQRPAVERWYRIQVQNQDAGVRRFRLWHCPGGEGGDEQMVVEEEDHFGFLRAGERIELRDRKRSLLDGDLRPLRVLREKRQRGQPPDLLEAGRIGEEMISIRGQDLKREPFEPQAVDSALFTRRLFAADGASTPAPAGPIRLRTWSPSAPGYVSDTLEVDTLSRAPFSARLILSPGDLPGMRIHITLDEARLPQEIRASLGQLHIAWLLRPARPQPGIPASLPDFDDMMRIETLGHMADPEQIASMTVRLHGLPPHIPAQTFAGPGQRILGEQEAGTVDLRTERLWPDAKQVRPFPLADLPPQLVPWTRPTALAQADDGRIARLARRLTKDAPDALHAALALRDWVAEEIDGDMGLNFASATEVLEAGRGDCSEKSVLLAALARAAGIPARVVAGLVYHQGAFAGHMWCEVWVGDWQPLDAALGPKRVSPARIRLGVQPLDLASKGAGDDAVLALLVSGMKVEILSTTAISGSASPPRPAPARRP